MHNGRIRVRERRGERRDIEFSTGRLNCGKQREITEELKLKNTTVDCYVKNNEKLAIRWIKPEVRDQGQQYLLNKRNKRKTAQEIFAEINVVRLEVCKGCHGKKKHVRRRFPWENCDEKPQKTDFWILALGG